MARQESYLVYQSTVSSSDNWLIGGRGVPGRGVGEGLTACAEHGG